MILTLKKRNKFIHKRFIVSIITLAFLTSSLVVGSVGSLMTQTSARSNRNGNYSNSSNQGRGDRTPSNSNSDQNKTVAPTASQKQTPTPPVTKKQTPVAPVAHSAPTPPSTPQITQAPAITREAPVAPVDTAADSSLMTSSQAATSASGQSIKYTTQRISDDTRNRLMVLAGIATVMGALLYTMSYVGSFSMSRRPIPVRYIVPVREVMTN